MANDIVWRPDCGHSGSSALARFAASQGFEHTDYASLHRWSVSDLDGFWSAMWDFACVTGEKGSCAFRPDPACWMTGARFFPDARLNLAENLLRGEGSAPVVRAGDESGMGAPLDRAGLVRRVARIASGLRGAGVKPGDRVAGILPNSLDALVALLASLSVGAVWTSCSPDFGNSGILDRIGQVSPKILFVAPLYTYNGRAFDISARLGELIGQLPSLTGIVVSGKGAEFSCPGIAATAQDEFGEECAPDYARLPFDHPAYILYTSGTTGIPKAIVHRAGGVLMQHLKEHLFHTDIRAGDRLAWYANTAWMMYHWMVSALGAGAQIVLYDGAPILKKPDGALDMTPLWRIAEEARLTHLGASPKYLATLEANGYVPRAHHRLDDVRVLMVSGAPMLPHQFDWVYESVKRDMMFASISGGTEIIGCFLTGSPIHPVRRGALTVPALGHAVAVLDERGVPVIGRRGALVCTEPFPSMPLTFWGPDGKARYHAAYFGERAQIWTHGDEAEMTPSGGAIVHGRLDNVINPGGVRIGVSEIYAVCEQFREIEDYLAFGLREAGDELVILCLKPAPSAQIDAPLARRLRARIRADVSPRHVPARIHVVDAVPCTVSGKRVESAARAIAAGQEVTNAGSLANADCLDQYRRLGAGDAL